MLPLSHLGMLPSTSSVSGLSCTSYQVVRFQYVSQLRQQSITKAELSKAYDAIHGIEASQCDHSVTQRDDAFARQKSKLWINAIFGREYLQKMHRPSALSRLCRLTTLDCCVVGESGDGSHQFFGHFCGERRCHGSLSGWAAWS